MLTGLLFSCVAVFVIITLTNWRSGVLFAIFIGMVQDPIRKLTPGTPATFILASLPLWALVWAGALGQAGGWGRFRRADASLAKGVLLFVVSLAPGTVVTLSYGLAASPVAALGIFAYTAPLLTMVAGFVFPRGPGDIERLLSRYSILAAVFLVGTFLEYGNLAPGWLAVGTEALGFEWLRYPVGGGVFKLISGFFRGPDIAAWHASAVVMIALTLGFFRKGLHTRWWLLLVAWGSACLMVTARRKGIMMPFVWTAFMALAFMRVRRMSTLIRLGLITAIAAAGFYYASGGFGISSEYYTYAGSTVADAPDRLVTGSWGAVWNTLEQSGTFGGGIGSATQGSQHLGIRVGDTWQESGPSKLMVEIGIPGFLGAIWLVWGIVRSAAMATKRAGSQTNVALLQLGLLAFCAANAASFMVSHQIYSDLTVLNLTAFFLGAALSAPEWGAVRQPVARPAPSLVSARRSPALPSTLQ